MVAWAHGSAQSANIFSSSAASDSCSTGGREMQKPHENSFKSWIFRWVTAIYKWWQTPFKREKIKQTKTGLSHPLAHRRLRGAKTKLPVCSHLNATFSCDLCEGQRKHYEKTFSKHNSLQQFTLYWGKTAETNIWAASIMTWIYLYRTNWVKGSVTKARPHQRTSLCSCSKHFTDATGASNESY